MPKKTQLPPYVVKRYNTYFAVLYIPKDIQYVIGKKKFIKTTGEQNIKLAQAIANVFVMGWKAEIAAARSKSDEPLINSAKEIKKLLKSSPKYLVDEVIEEEVARLHKERKPIDAEVFKRISKGENSELLSI
jgi:hypothetical protein